MRWPICKLPHAPDKRPACFDTGLNLLSTALFAVTVLRMALLCLPAPITGYANNLDFFRQSACLGVWEAYTDRPRISAKLDAPLNDLVYDGQRIAGLCMRSSDNLFAWAAAHLHRKHTHLQLREIGPLRLLAASVLAILLLCQPIEAAARLACALALLLVLGDIAIGSYFDTLYVDASGILAATLSILAAVTLCARTRTPPLGLCVLASAMLFWLGNVKPQYQPLAFLFGAADAAIMAWAWRNRRLASLFLAVAVLSPLTFTALNAGPDRIMRTAYRVNQADSLLGAVLPEAPDKKLALRLLGLPESCAAAIGKNGYAPEIRLKRQCPEIARVNHLRLLGVFAAEPETFIRPLLTAMDLSRPAYLEYLHPFERRADATSLRIRILRATSPSVWLARLTPSIYRWLLAGICATGLICSAAFAVLLPRPAFRRVLPGVALLALGGSTCFYALLSAVFGDGYMESARHSVLVLAGPAFCLSGTLLLAIRRKEGLLF